MRRPLHKSGIFGPAFSLLISRSVVCALLPLTLLPLGAARADDSKRLTPPAPAVRIAQPSRGDIIRFVTLPGTVRANQQATLFAKVAGYLSQITVDKGDNVKQGQLLAQLEVPELAADVKKYEADAKLLQIELDRLTQAKIKAPDLILPQDLDKARGALEVAQAGRERTQTLLGYAKIAAPFGGVVTMRYVDPGAFVRAATAGGPPESAAIVTIMDFDIVRIQCAIPEIDAPLVRVGEPVKVSVDGLPNRVFDGKVTRFSYALDEATRTMLVETDLPNPDHDLRPGMSATVKTGVENHANALLVPVDAVVMEKAAAFVFKFVEGKAKKTPVTLGFSDGINIELLKGLIEGEPVILVGKGTFADGQPVQLAEVK
jgi:RND family efflux transporter MFP subunit